MLFDQDIPLMSVLLVTQSNNYGNKTPERLSARVFLFFN
jgi:hypothetical protein